MLRIQHDNGVVTLASALLRERGVTHAFTTRIGGHSTGPYAALNLMPADGPRDAPAATSDAPEADCDDPAHLRGNEARLMQALGCEQHRLVRVRQVHGREVHTIANPALTPEPLTSHRNAHPPSSHLPAAATAAAEDPQALATADRVRPCADALVTSDAGALLCICVADCVPILLAGPDGRVVAAVHAGWRGLLGGVVVEAVEVLCEHAGEGARQPVVAADLVAAIGPCISKAHFEVGLEVAQPFEARFGTQVVDRTHGAQPHVDLSLATQRELLSMGLRPEAIEVCDACTWRDEALFFSHRRDRGITGRMAGVITPRA